MCNEITTLAQAVAYRYRVWAGSPRGTAYVIGKCAATVPDNDRSCLSHQCRIKNGHGPNGLYCLRHAKRVRATISEAQPVATNKQFNAVIK
jgi:hypothetical protein